MCTKMIKNGHNVQKDTSVKEHVVLSTVRRGINIHHKQSCKLKKYKQTN